MARAQLDLRFLTQGAEKCDGRGGNLWSRQLIRVEMDQATVLILEPDVLMREPLAAYLRECGYRVLTSGDAAEARRVITEGGLTIDVALADAAQNSDEVFRFVRWLHSSNSGIKIILSGSVTAAASAAGQLCEENEGAPKKHHHSLIADRIRRLLAERNRAGPAK